MVPGSLVEGQQDVTVVQLQPAFSRYISSLYQGSVGKGFSMVL